MIRIVVEKQRWRNEQSGASGSGERPRGGIINNDGRRCPGKFVYLRHCQFTVRPMISRSNLSKCLYVGLLPTMVLNRGCSWQRSKTKHQNIPCHGLETVFKKEIHSFHLHVLFLFRLLRVMMVCQTLCRRVPLSQWTQSSQLVHSSPWQ